MEVPHFDRVFGSKEVSKESAEELLAKRFEKVGGSRLAEFEIEKSEKDVRVIDLVERSALEYMKRYGRLKHVEIPLQNIHFLKEGGLEELTQGRSQRGAYSPTLGSIMIDRSPSDAETAYVLFHEMIHVKSYHSAQPDPDGSVHSRRGGFEAVSRDRTVRYFNYIDEAIVGLLTKRFENEVIRKHPLFRGEIARGWRPLPSREQEVESLNLLIDKLWEKNMSDYKSREEIVDLFINAHANGRLLPVARLIERTLGPGAFRMLGEEMGKAITSSANAPASDKKPKKSGQAPAPVKSVPVPVPHVPPAPTFVKEPARKLELVEAAPRESASEHWTRIEAEVERIKDALGRPIDAGIKKSVVALKANGFGTTGSCEGHLDWGLPYPWIDVESSISEALLNDAHYEILKRKARAHAKGQQAMTPAELKEHAELVSLKQKSNEREYLRLHKLLDEFYGIAPKSGELRPVRLGIKKGPWNQSRLMPEDRIGEERRLIVSESEARADAQRIKLYQNEMARLSEFLKQKSFEVPKGGVAELSKKKDGQSTDSYPEKKAA